MTTTATHELTPTPDGGTEFVLGIAWSGPLGWLCGLLTGLFAAAGHPPARATRLARMSLAVARGLLFDLAITGDRKAADRAMTEFVALLPRA